MNGLTLRKLALTDKEDFTKFLSELVRDSALKGVEIPDGYEFEKLLDYYKEKETLPFISYEQSDYPFFQYVLVENESGLIVGAVIIRPFLTKHLDKDFEGNIGYSIRPCARGKGYGKVGLSLALREFKKLNPNGKAILCCYKENLGSSKIIKSQGGKLIEESKGVLTPQKYVIE